MVLIGSVGGRRHSVIPGSGTSDTFEALPAERARRCIIPRTGTFRPRPSRPDREEGPPGFIACLDLQARKHLPSQSLPQSNRPGAMADRAIVRNSPDIPRRYSPGDIRPLPRPCPHHDWSSMARRSSWWQTRHLLVSRDNRVSMRCATPAWRRASVKTAAGRCWCSRSLQGSKRRSRAQSCP